jgi:hypothetical protein
MDDPQGDEVIALEIETCWSLLKTQKLGRLALAAERVEIFPVNYLVNERSIYFASAPGTKLMELAQNPDVAFEVDGTASHDLWSVIIHGRTRRLARDFEIEGSGILQLQPWHPTPKHNYIRIRVDEITGRRFRRPRDDAHLLPL